MREAPALGVLVRTCHQQEVRLAAPGRICLPVPVGAAQAEGIAWGEAACTGRP
jgi:hypothetical protein